MFSHRITVTECWLHAACVLLVSALLFLKYWKNRRLPPGPVGLPLLGYLPFKGTHPAKTYYNLSKRYGPVISVNMAISTVVVLNDYDSINEVSIMNFKAVETEFSPYSKFQLQALVKNGNTFSGRPKLAVVAEQGTSYGIVTKNFDKDFKRSRKFTLAALRSFGFGKQSMEEKINEEISCLLDLLQSKGGRPFNCHTEFAISVSNVLCNITLGKRYSYDDEDFRRMIKGVIRSFSNKEDAVGLSVINLFPLSRFVPPLQGIYKKFQEDVRYNNGVFGDIIDEHQKTFDPENTRDFVDEYIKEMQKSEGKDPAFNKTQLVHVLHDLFVAGTETTSSTLCWCFLLFAHHPDIQDKVAAEIRDVIGDNQVTMKHRDSMHYMQAFLHEITRHRTLAILSIPHATTDDVTFRGYYIPKDTIVLPNLWAVHHDPQNFENPDEFNPDRFIDDSGKFVPHKKVIPFSVGPRYCLGQQLAKMEMFLFLANIAQKFEIVSNADQPMPDYCEGVVGVGELPPEYEVKFIPR